MTLLVDVRAAVAGGRETPPPRAAVLEDLVQSFETYFGEHRTCAALAAAIVEAERSDAAWAVAWMVCGGCGVRWERHLKLPA